MTEATVPSQRTENGKQQVPQTYDESRHLAPPVDIFETEDGVTVVADVPGASKDDIDIRIDKNVLTLRAEAHGALPVEAMRQEYQLHDYYRQFRIGETVDQDNVKAEMKQGVLIITLPKKAETKPKQIKVDVG